MKPEEHATRPHACGDDPLALEANSCRLRGPRRVRASRRRAVLHALGLVLLGWTSLAIGGCVPTSPGPAAIPFDRERWIAEPGSHGQMVDDLIANHLRVGMTKAEVAELLGMDVTRMGQSVSEDVGPVPSERMRFTCCHFAIDFDDQGLFTGTSISAY